MQIQALLTEETVAKRGAATEVARPQMFDETPSKVSRFITVCRLYLRMKMREMAVEEQIQ